MSESGVLKFAYECIKVSIRLAFVLTLPDRYFEDTALVDKLYNYVLTGEFQKEDES